MTVVITAYQLATNKYYMTQKNINIGKSFIWHSEL